MNKIFNELSKLVTEQRNEATFNIDELNTVDMVRLINSEDKKVPLAVEKEVEYIAEAVDIVTNAFKNGGRLIYIGAGTSGRLGVLDASECPPTFGVPEGMVVGLIAGGLTALHKAVEGFEDHEEYGAKDLKNIDLTEKDVVCGIAASKRTPYVLGGLKYAKSMGAKTLAVVCNPRENLSFDVDTAICVVPGPEVITGSTRLKAGSSQKMVLNMITTSAMIKLGKVYENMMIDLQQNNLKLVERSKKIIMMASDATYDEAAMHLNNADGHVKTAIFLSLTDANVDEAKFHLEKNGGFLKQAIRDWNNKQN